MRVRSSHSDRRRNCKSTFRQLDIDQLACTASDSKSIHLLPRFVPAFHFACKKLLFIDAGQSTFPLEGTLEIDFFCVCFMIALTRMR